MWVQKHKPISLKEFRGNSKNIKDVIQWVNNWKNEKNKSVLIHGPPGMGKTTFVQLLAKELDYHLIETNASDVRNASTLKEEFGNAVNQTSLFFKNRLILFDEMDGLSSGDRGGAPEILDIIKNTSYPIILIANDAYKPKLRNLRNNSKLIKFNKIRMPSIAKRLKEICSVENIEYEDKAIDFISRTSNGDLKAAINDLQAMSKGKKSLKHDEITDLSYRDTEKKIFDSLRIIFKTEKTDNAAEALDNIEKPLDETMQWIRENLPLEYSDNKDLARAYQMLSRADVFRGRIIRQQYWRYLAYVSQLMSIGIALSKEKKYNKFVMYKYPSKIANLGRTKAIRAKENKIAENLGRKLHCSKKIAKEYFFLLKLIEKHNPEQYEELIAE